MSDPDDIFDAPIERAPTPSFTLPPFSEIKAQVDARLKEAVPGCKTWTPADWERMRASDAPADEAIKDGIILGMLSERFSKSISELAAARGAMADPDLPELIGIEGREIHNIIALALNGVGEDHIMLNECFAEGTTLLSFRTVGDWDRDQSAFQEGARGKEDPSYEAKPYVGSAYAVWVRGVIDDRFSYITLSTLAGHLLSVIESAASDAIEALTPHRYVKNPNHGEETRPGMFLWSMRVDANGKEALYEALRTAERTYTNERYTALATRFAQEAAGKTWLIPRDGPFDAPWESNYDALFSDPTAMDRTRWTCFVKDMKVQAANEDEITALVQEETARVVAHLNAVADAYTDGTETTPQNDGGITS